MFGMKANFFCFYLTVTRLRLEITESATFAAPQIYESLHFDQKVLTKLHRQVIGKHHEDTVPCICVSSHIASHSPCSWVGGTINMDTVSGQCMTYM